MSAKVVKTTKYLQVYKEIYNLGLSPADFYHFLEFCQNELQYKSCEIKYKTDKGLAKKHDRNDKEFSKFIGRLIKKDIIRRSTFDTFEIIDKESKNVTMRVLLINPDYVFFGEIDAREDELLKFLCCK